MKIRTITIKNRLLSGLLTLSTLEKAEDNGSTIELLKPIDKYLLYRKYLKILLAD